MEFDILNELLSESVAKLFNPKAVYSFKKPQPMTDNFNLPAQGKNTSTNTSISSISSQQSQPSEISQRPMSQQCSIDQWISVVGPQRLSESLAKLNIDLSRLTKRDLEQMTLDTLNNEKKRVKNELKSYDAQFQGIFNRFPLRNEKEPMRPLYIYYKKLKQQLDKVMDNQAAHPVLPNKPIVQMNNQLDVQRRIEELKKIRAELREKLNLFQLEFTQNHNRKIRFHKDIAPVEREYKMYKDIKLEIQRLEGNQQR